MSVNITPHPSAHRATLRDMRDNTDEIHLEAESAYLLIEQYGEKRIFHADHGVIQFPDLTVLYRPDAKITLHINTPEGITQAFHIIPPQNVDKHEETLSILDEHLRHIEALERSMKRVNNALFRESIFKFNLGDKK